MLDSFKKMLVEQGSKLLQSPAVMKLLQNEKLMKAAMQTLMLRGRIEGAMDEQLEKIAKRLQLATREEVREVQRALRRLEEQAERRATTATAPSEKVG